MSPYLAAIMFSAPAHRTRRLTNWPFIATCLTIGHKNIRYIKKELLRFVINLSFRLFLKCVFSLLPLLGIFFVLPCIESYQKVDLRTITLGVPPQEVCSNNLAYEQIFSSLGTKMLLVLIQISVTNHYAVRFRF